MEFSGGVKWKYGGVGVDVDLIVVSDGIKVDNFWVGVIVGVAVVVLQPTSMSPVMLDKRISQTRKLVFLFINLLIFFPHKNE